MRSFSYVLVIGILAAATLLISPAEAGNAFRKSKTKKGKRRYPPKQDGDGRCKPDQTLVELVVCASGPEGDHDKKRKDFDILRDLLLLSGLNPADLEDVTVFAPDDRAFYRLAKEWGYDEKYDEVAIVEHIAIVLGIVAGAADIDGELEDLVAAVLLYHVADEDLSFDKLRKEIKINTLLSSDDYEGELESEKANKGRVRLVHGDSLATNPKLHNRFQDLNIEEGRLHAIKNVLIFDELTVLLVAVAEALEEALPGFKDGFKRYLS